MQRVAITGSTGYLGRSLSRALVDRGHTVLALARPGGAPRVEPGAQALELDVFDEDALVSAIAGCDTLVQLIGTPHPNPSKAAQFRSVDLESACRSAGAARR